MNFLHHHLPAYNESYAAYAYGEPQSRGHFKAQPEDFVVEEILNFPLSGEGEHLFMQVQTRDQNTRYTQKLLAASLSLPLRALSYSGLKDRHGVTTQWFSAHLPGKHIEPDKVALLQQGVTLLDCQRHSKKLKIGTHKFNRFVIRLRKVQHPEAMIERLAIIEQQGVPNYFGAQRFGWNGGNVKEALEWVERGELPSERQQRSRVLSTIRSWLFNGQLSQRVRLNRWQFWQPSDPIVLDGSHSFFLQDWDSELQARYQSGDIHLGSWLPGVDSDDEFHLQWASTFSGILEQADIKKSVRALRLLPREMQMQSDEGDVRLQFVLPVGAYATAVLREWVQLDQMP